MTAPRRTARPARSLALAALLVAVPVLTACGASSDAQTYQERNNADSSSTAVGALALRGISVLPPLAGKSFRAGGTAEAVLTVTNADSVPDTLVEVSTPAASSVQVLASNRPATLRVPPLGSTGQAITLRLVGLTSELREGEYVTLSFRFARNGSIEVPVPVAVSGRTDRPVYTGEEGGEGEPALQAPAGGHHSEDKPETGEAEGESEDTGAGQEGAEGNVDEAEGGAAEGDTTPRSGSVSPSASPVD